MDKLKEEQSHAMQVWDGGSKLMTTLPSVLSVYFDWVLSLELQQQLKQPMFLTVLKHIKN